MLLHLRLTVPSELSDDVVELLAHENRSANLTLSPGEFVAVVGRSGCGKSTLMRLLAGLTDPSAGEVRVQGERVRGINGNCRVMFQDARLLPWKRALNNVGLGLSGNWKPRARELLAQVGLGERSHFERVSIVVARKLDVGAKREYLALNLLAKALQNGERNQHHGNAQGNTDRGNAGDGMGEGADVGPVHLT